MYTITHTKEKPDTTNWYFSQNWKIGIRQWKSKEWANFELECLLLIFIYSNSKFKVTCKNADFECWYIRIHTKEKSSKISNITLATLPFYQKKNTHILNGHPEYLGTYYSWWNHQMPFKMVSFNIKTQNLELVNLKYATYAQPIPLSLKKQWANWEWDIRCTPSIEDMGILKSLLTFFK